MPTIKGPVNFKHTTYNEISVLNIARDCTMDPPKYETHETYEAFIVEAGNLKANEEGGLEQEKQTCITSEQTH